MVFQSVQFAAPDLVIIMGNSRTYFAPRKLPILSYCCAMLPLS